MKKKIYLASPFFNATELVVYKETISRLRSAGYPVHVPQEHEVPNAWDLPNSDWAKCVFEMDIEAIHDCDVVMVLNFGMYSDSGTAWECGAAFALGKKVVNILCGCDDTEYSIMMVNGTNTTIDLDTFRKEWFANIVEYIGKTPGRAVPGQLNWEWP